jgi:hypothetical protein
VLQNTFYNVWPHQEFQKQIHLPAFKMAVFKTPKDAHEISRTLKKHRVMLSQGINGNDKRSLEILEAQLEQVRDNKLVGNIIVCVSNKVHIRKNMDRMNTLRQIKAHVLFKNLLIKAHSVHKLNGLEHYEVCNLLFPKESIFKLIGFPSIYFTPGPVLSLQCLNALKQLKGSINTTRDAKSVYDQLFETHKEIYPSLH